MNCELAATDLINHLLNNVDNKILNGLLSGNLEKAFDIINHSILASKLQIYGCFSSTVSTSYLSDRFQCTNFKGTQSDLLPISIGVPQGDILGPLFFLLFINDLPLFLPQNTTLAVFASGVFAWDNLNDMTLNTSKTKSILITSQQKF